MTDQLRPDRDDKNIVEKGFTLIELLLVVVILGILAGIVVFAVGNMSDSARTSACQTDASSTEAAAEAYKAKTGAYPLAMADLTTPGVNQMLKTSPKTYNAAAADVKGQFRVTWGAAFATIRPADGSCPA